MATSTISAAQLRSMISHYDSLVVDASACVGKKEIENWCMTANRGIDGNVKILENGKISKRNESLKDQLAESYRRLAKKIGQMEHRLKAESQTKLYLVK